MAYVYRHRKKSTLEVFYIGVGSYKGYKRARSKSERSEFWHKTVKKHGYIIEIIQDNITHEEAFELEMFLIQEYGRRDLGLGSLVNLSDGGEGNINMSKDSRIKISKGLKEYYKKHGYPEDKRLRQKEIMKGNSYRLGAKTSNEEKIRRSIARSKLILNTETGIFYLGIENAAKSINKNKSWLIRRLLGYISNNTNFIYA